VGWGSRAGPLTSSWRSVDRRSTQHHGPIGPIQLPVAFDEKTKRPDQASDIVLTDRLVVNDDDASVMPVEERPGADQ